MTLKHSWVKGFNWLEVQLSSWSTLDKSFHWLADVCSRKEHNRRAEWVPSTGSGDLYCYYNITQRGVQPLIIKGRQPLPRGLLFCCSVVGYHSGPERRVQPNGDESNLNAVTVSLRPSHTFKAPVLDNASWLNGALQQSVVHWRQGLKRRH